MCRCVLHLEESQRDIVSSKGQSQTSHSTAPEVRTKEYAAHVPLKDRQEGRGKKKKHRASPVKMKLWLPQTSMAGLIRLIPWSNCPKGSTNVCLVPARLGGPPGQLCELFLHTCPRVCLVLLCICGLRPADQGKPGAPVTAGSLDRSLPRLPLLLRFILRWQTPTEGEEKLLSPGCCSFTLSSARSLTLTVHPSLLGSPPPPIRFLVTPVTLSLSL